MFSGVFNLSLMFGCTRLGINDVMTKQVKKAGTNVKSINPLSPSTKLQILMLCFHTFLTEVVGRSCKISIELNLSDRVLNSHDLTN